MTKDKPKQKYKPSKLISIVLIIFAVLVCGAGLGFLTASIQSMPSLKGEIRPPASSQFFDIHGNLITTTQSVENRLPVSINKIPKDLQNAFIAAEDARFYQHSGIDPKGIIRAIWSNITDRGVSEGGSTITQQLAKNALLSQERTLKRKIQEAFLALQIEHQYSKTEILEMYLNHIYFGQGAYGVQAASLVYFGKNVEDLNLAECAMLAGIPKSPNYYSPLNNLTAAKSRQHTVIDQMEKYGYLDAMSAQKAKTTDIKLARQTTKKQTVASYFIDYVTQILIDKYGADAIYKDGLKIYTTLDLNMQKAAEDAIDQLPTYYTDKNTIKQPQGALVAIDPNNGYIKAMVGGRGNDQFNRAVLAERQPGSAFKPFVYLAAIESGLTPYSVIDDSPISFGGWSPSNYDGSFHGSVTLATALAHSLNIPAVKLAQQVGVDKPLYYAQQMGISTLVLNGATNDRNLATALGGLTKGVTPLEIASAYGVLANHGIRVEPTPIIKIVDRNGKVIEQHIPKEKSVINERSANILTGMLRNVITSGTGAAANIGRPAAGKTGTTNDYKDAWFVGYTPDLVAAVWMGCDNQGTLSGITGGALPARMWRSFMSAALSGIPARDFDGNMYYDSSLNKQDPDKDKKDANKTDKKDDKQPPGKDPTKDKLPPVSNKENDKNVIQQVNPSSNKTNPDAKTKP